MVYSLKGAMARAGALMAIGTGSRLSLFVSPYGASETNKIFDDQEGRSELESLVPGRFQKNKNTGKNCKGN